jgi:prepilin-type N-terminal cleavage/methylation domain-containing protein
MRAWQRAFTLLELMIVVSVLGLLTILAIPGFSKSRTTATGQRCLQNQRIIHDGVLRYEMDTRSSLYSARNNSATIRQNLLNSQYIRLAAVFECPNSGDKNNADYRLLYANSTTFTNTLCLIKSAHVLR